MNVNIELLKELERSIDTINPERGKIPIKILGFGELSLVFEILNDPQHYAYKRSPIFENERQAKKHEYIFREYNRILNEEINIKTPPLDVVWFKNDEGRIIFYGIQEKIPADSVGNYLIHHVGQKDVETLILKVMREMKKVWTFNKENRVFEVGLDGQISNFAVLNYDPNNPRIDHNSQLLYIDTFPPFFRKNGTEAMNMRLLTKALPSYIRGLVNAIFVDDLVDRYYIWRDVAIDLIANFFKEQLPKYIPGLLKVVNDFFKQEARMFEIETISLKEIQKYYKFDKFVWALMYNLRIFDRYIKTKLFRKNYEFYLPGKIKR
jgi:hypothetical protein